MRVFSFFFASLGSMLILVPVLEHWYLMAAISRALAENGDSRMSLDGFPSVFHYASLVSGSALLILGVVLALLHMRAASRRG